MIQAKRERGDSLISSKRVLSIPENGKAASEMAKVNSHGLMVPNTQVSGEKIGLMARADSFT